MQYICTMAIILFDNKFRDNLAPLCLNKAVADLRMGILTIQERWCKLLNNAIYIHTSALLQPLYPIPAAAMHVWIDAAVLPTAELLKRIDGLKPGQALVDEFGLIAGINNISFDSFDPSSSDIAFSELIPIDDIKRIEFPWDLIQLNGQFIQYDFKLISKGRKSQPISSTVQVAESADIFIEEGAKLEFCILNATTGPIYIGKNAEVMEGTTIRGPFSLGDHSVLKMNSRVYGATTLGPYCMGGGEIKNAIMMGYSNKAHDGYLGDAVIGEWCNFGAGTSNSNLKNSAAEVAVWAMNLKKMVVVGQKCGVIMGDYSRVAINSSINTGSVIGLCCSVFGAGLLPKRMSNFSFGIEGKKYNIQNAIADINNWKMMKGKSLSDIEINILNQLHQTIEKQ